MIEQPRERKEETMARDFKAEGITERKNHPERKPERAARMRARRAMEKKLGGIPSGMQVEHHDGNPRNNASINLRLVTAKANNNGRRGGPARRK